MMEVYLLEFSRGYNKNGNGNGQVSHREFVDPAKFAEAYQALLFERMRNPHITISIGSKIINPSQEEAARSQLDAWALQYCAR